VCLDPFVSYFPLVYCRTWWTITGHYGNILPIDWSQSYARKLHEKALNLGERKVIQINMLSIYQPCNNTDEDSTCLMYCLYWGISSNLKSSIFSVKLGTSYTWHIPSPLYGYRVSRVSYKQYRF